MSDNASETLSAFLQGETELVVSHPGRSQYSALGRGASACGLAVLNCARLVLQDGQRVGNARALLERLLDRSFLEVSPDRCRTWLVLTRCIPGSAGSMFAVDKYRSPGRGRNLRSPHLLSKPTAQMVRLRTTWSGPVLLCRVCKVRRFEKLSRRDMLKILFSGRYFETEVAKEAHLKTKLHKRRCKRLQEPAYTIEESERAAGLGRDTRKATAVQSRPIETEEMPP